MKRLLVLLLVLTSWPAAAAQVAVECAGVTTEAGRTRILLDTSAAISHRIFMLSGPDRVVIDIPNAGPMGHCPESPRDDPNLIKVRSGVHETADLRVVLDVKHPVRVKSLPVSGGRYGHRLIVDLLPNRAAPVRPHDRTVKVRGSGTPSGRSRVAIVAIDAGHGGQDPGAIGPSGIREKDVTLAIARKLERLVARESGMRPLMIRDGDRFVALRERMQRAREHKADLFVSIHADAFNNADAHGSSVYTLSQDGASSEAANWLADQENEADRRGGLDLGSGDEGLAEILMEMSYNATLEHSAEAANAVLTNLRKIGAVHKADVQRAGFVVLKSPDVPSLLVETAFISNCDEEQRLRSNAHQQRLARAILAGIKAYFEKFPPQRYLIVETESTTDAAIASVGRPLDNAVGLREHVISRGDTLSDIARQYRVSVSSLRAQNGLGENDYIRVGEVLAIPAGS